MSTVNGVGGNQNGGFFKYLWETMTEGDVGNGIQVARFPDMSIMIIGSYGGTTITIEGSNDNGTTWVTLTEADGTTAMSYSTGNQLKAILENTELVRPQTTGGSATDLDVHFVGRSNT